ncbi:SUF system NifU family Fe-S cluster assembly protein [bacterium]|nr:SUF system NifU family Fe-S cluster assembly protein [bacterium]
MDLKALYREVILDHYKAPRNTAPLVQPDRQADCRNPSCGDKIKLQLKFDNDRVSEVAMLGNGCAISQASASMMTEALKGRTLAEIDRVVEEFRAMIVNGSTEFDRQVLGDLVILEGVAKLHARVKCAMCGWSALDAALHEDGSDVNLDEDREMPASSRG